MRAAVGKEQAASLPARPRRRRRCGKLAGSCSTGLGGEIGRRAGLKIPFREECRFDSDPRHQARAPTCGTIVRMSDAAPRYPTIEDTIGATPLVRLVRLPGAANERRGNVILGKLEGNNPAGSVKDRPAISMIRRAEERGDDQARRHPDRGDLGQHRHRPGDGGGDPRLPDAARHAGGPDRRAGADDEGVRRRADPDAALAAAWSTRATSPSRCRATARAVVLDQFANADNPRIHYETTGPEIWRDTGGRITHFVSAMGTTGTITGVSRYLKEQNPAVRIIGAQPSEGSRIPGIRKWPRGLPAEDLRPEHGRRAGAACRRPTPRRWRRRLAREEGIFAGISAAGACWVALQLAEQVESATIVFVVCDRGDRYLSTGVFPA